MTVNVIRLPAATVIRQAYEEHLAELSVQERNVRHHAAAIAFRRCMVAIIKETNASEQRAAKYLVRLGLKDPRIPVQTFKERMRFATWHTRHIPQ